jgi:hypothetical protein
MHRREQRTAVGEELVVAHPTGHTQSAWVAVILSGPALFLVGRAGLEYAVFGRVSPDRWIGLLVLTVLSPAPLLLPPLLAATAATAVLAGIAIADTARARRHPRATVATTRPTSVTVDGQRPDPTHTALRSFIAHRAAAGPATR